MIFTWIAVALVLSLLIGFVTLSVLWTARSVSRSIRERSLELISAYDELLERRSRELSALDAELERLTPGPEQAAAPAARAAAEPEEPRGDPAGMLKAAERLSATPYQSSGTGAAYRRIRENFFAPSDETVRELAERSADPPADGAAALLDVLPFDVVFRLSTLPGEEQLSLLREAVPREQRGLLEDFAAASPRFDCIAFYDMLKARAAGEGGRVRLRVAPQDARAYPASLDVTVDEDICEGYQVELDNMLYDYAIKTGEIG